MGSTRIGVEPRVESVSLLIAIRMVRCLAHWTFLSCGHKCRGRGSLPQGDADNTEDIVPLSRVRRGTRPIVNTV